MTSAESPDSLLTELTDHAEQVEGFAKHNANFDQYTVLGMHADVRVFLDNWAAYSDEQHQQIAATVHNICNIRDEGSDFDGYFDNELAEIAQLKQDLDSTSDLGATVTNENDDAEPPAVSNPDADS